MNKLVPILFLAILTISACAGKGARKEAAKKKENSSKGGIAKFEFPAERNMKVAGTCEKPDDPSVAPSAYDDITFFEPKVLFYWSSDPKSSEENALYKGSSFLATTPERTLEGEFKPNVLLAGFHSGNFKSGKYQGQQYWLIYAETDVDNGYDGEVAAAFFRFAYDPKSTTLTSLPKLRSGITRTIAERLTNFNPVVAPDKTEDESNEAMPAPYNPGQYATKEQYKLFSEQYEKYENRKSALAATAIQNSIKRHLKSKLRYDVDPNYKLREFLKAPDCIMVNGIPLRNSWPNIEYSRFTLLKLNDPILNHEIWHKKAANLDKSFRYIESPYFGKMYGAGYKWTAYLPDGETLEYRWSQPEQIDVKIGSLPEQNYSCFMPGGKRSDPEPITTSTFVNASNEKLKKHDLIKVGESKYAGDLFAIQRDEDHDEEFRNYNINYHNADQLRQTHEEEDSDEPEVKSNKAPQGPVTLDDIPIGNSSGAFSYSEFTKQYPYVNVRSPFGDLFECRKKVYFDTDRWAEPLVYVYSNERKTFRIELPKNIALVDTKPPARWRGWTFSTNLDGSLTLQDSGETVPHLFWEGEVSRNSPNKTGFVISANDSFGFFKAKLRFLGLSAREISDFIQFWADNYHFAPYYYVRFLSQSEIEMRAPLTVTPPVRTRIRISIVVSPSQTPFIVPPQKLIPGPKRIGDTLVEWGVIPN